MFNPFFTTRSTGTGLGLAIVHRIVDAHGGHVNVGAGRRGGARVELCVPLQPPRRDETTQRAGALVDVDRISLNGATGRASREDS
jgi:nitrogen-specific signal transduction histidine kinase